MRFKIRPFDLLIFTLVFTSFTPYLHAESGSVTLSSVGASTCHVSIVEITPDGFTHIPAAVADFQSTTAQGGECADEMKTHVKDFARSCHSPNSVLAEIKFQAGKEKSVEAELAMECGAGSKRKPASEETDRVNRYINEAYNKIQSDYDSHPLTDLNLPTPGQSRNGNSARGQESNGIVYEGDNTASAKEAWLQTESTPASATSPDEVVEQRLKDRTVAATENSEDASAQNAYIQEFIRNAKADGWSIRVKNGQLQVVPRSRAQ